MQKSVGKTSLENLDEKSFDKSGPYYIDANNTIVYWWKLTDLFIYVHWGANKNIPGMC